MLKLLVNDKKNRERCTGTWLRLRFLCSMIHSSIPGCHFIGKYSATDIARGTSEKTSSGWLVRWGFISLVILVPDETQQQETNKNSITHGVCRNVISAFSEGKFSRKNLDFVDFPRNFSFFLRKFLIAFF